MSDYTYTKSVSFPNGVDVALLDSQIRNDTTIKKFLFSIVESETTVVISFDFPLSTAEKTALDNIVAAHVPPVGFSNLVLSTPAADSSAIQLVTTNAAGGILIQSGTGGIRLVTTNAFLVNAAAESGITTTGGDLNLRSSNALARINGLAGINIGNEPSNGPVNIATSLNQRQINIGNPTGNTGVAIFTGTSGFAVDTVASPISLDAVGAASNFSLSTNAAGQDLTLALLGSTLSRLVLLSQGTGPDAIFLNSIGGITLNSQSSPINLVSNAAVGNAVNIDTNSGGGGIILSSGSFGIGINSNGGALGIGHFSGGDLYIGTAAVARPIFLGNTTAGVNLYQRFGNAFVSTQPAPYSIPDANTTLTAANLLSIILIGNPTATRTLTLPTVSALTAAIPNLIQNDSIEISIINLATLVALTFTNTIIGNNTIAAGTTGRYRIRFTGSPVNAYTVYRV